MNIKLGSRPIRAEDSGPAPVDALVTSVDHVLQSLPRRDRLTQQEAGLALAEVLHGAEASAAGPTVVAILDPVLSSIEHHTIVERRLIVDALLDTRLALEH